MKLLKIAIVIGIILTISFVYVFTSKENLNPNQILGSGIGMTIFGSATLAAISIYLIKR